MSGLVACRMAAEALVGMNKTVSILQQVAGHRRQVFIHWHLESFFDATVGVLTDSAWHSYSLWRVVAGKNLRTNVTLSSVYPEESKGRRVNRRQNLLLACGLQIRR
jgi:hypothetical protein